MLLEDIYTARTPIVDNGNTPKLGHQIGEAYERALSLDVPNFKLAGLARKPAEMVNFLRCHGARARRQTLPKQFLVLECYNGNGSFSVEISFGDKN